MTTDESKRPDVTSETLVDQPVEVGAELTMINAHRWAGQRRDFVASDERAANGLYRAKFGHWFAMARHDERLACCYRIDHLRIVIAEITLRDCLGHNPSVAYYATLRYSRPVTSCGSVEIDARAVNEEPRDVHPAYLIWRSLVRHPRP